MADLTVSQENAERRERAVADIASRMARGDWSSGSALEVAAEYDVSAITASRWAGEASRQLRALERLDVEALRAALVARLEKHERAAGDGTREAITAVKHIADIEGVGADFRARANELVVWFLTELTERLAARLDSAAYDAVMQAWREVAALPQGAKGKR